VDLSLPDRAQRSLALDDSRAETGHPLLDEEALDLFVLDIPRPHDNHVGDAGVPDPGFRSVDDPGVAIAPRACLESDRVRSVLGLGQGEGTYLLHPCHRTQPLLLLLVRPVHRDRAHRKACLDAEERAEAAIAAAELHLHEAGGERIHRRAAVADQPVADQSQLPKALREGQREVSPLPVVSDHRQHLVLNEMASPGQVVPLLV